MQEKTGASTKGEILRLLQDRGDFMSGQEICRQLSISRTAVWKAVNQLRAEGYELEAVRSRGYRLLCRPDVMTKEEVESRLHTRRVGSRVLYFDSTDSTNVQAKQWAERHAGGDGMLFVADTQVAGRGRRGRSWTSPPGSGIAMSLLLRPELPTAMAPMLTIVMALAVARALEKETALPVQIKWPNDIICRGRKLVGILTEMSAEMDAISYVVIGVGINVNTTAFPPELADKATSLFLERRGWQDGTDTGPIRRAPLIARVMEEFEPLYDDFLKTGDLSGMYREYNRLLVNVDRTVRILDPAGEYTAVARGIDETGELLVVTSDGQQKKVYAGEVSVRGVYGYV